MGKLSILIQGMKQKIHIFGENCKKRGIRYDSWDQCRGRRKINASKMEKSFGGNWGQMWQRWSVLMTSDSLDDTHSTQYFLQNIYNNSFNPFYVEMARLTSVPLIKAAYIWLKQRIRSAWERLMTSTDTCVKRVWSCAKKAGDWSGLGGGEGWLVGQLHGGTESNGRLLFSVKARPACCCCCTDKWAAELLTHPPLLLPHQHSLQIKTAVSHHNVWAIQLTNLKFGQGQTPVHIFLVNLCSCAV